MKNCLLWKFVLYKQLNSLRTYLHISVFGFLWLFVNFTVFKLISLLELVLFRLQWSDLYAYLHISVPCEIKLKLARYCRSRSNEAAWINGVILSIVNQKFTIIWMDRSVKLSWEVLQRSLSRCWHFWIKIYNVCGDRN